MVFVTAENPLVIIIIIVFCVLFLAEHFCPAVAPAGLDRRECRTFRGGERGEEDFKRISGALSFSANCAAVEASPIVVAAPFARRGRCSMLLVVRCLLLSHADRIAGPFIFIIICRSLNLGEVKSSCVDSVAISGLTCRCIVQRSMKIGGRKRFDSEGRKEFPRAHPLTCCSSKRFFENRRTRKLQSQDRAPRPPPEERGRALTEHCVCYRRQVYR